MYLIWFTTFMKVHNPAEQLRSVLAKLIKKKSLPSIYIMQIYSEWKHLFWKMKVTMTLTNPCYLTAHFWAQNIITYNTLKTKSILATNSQWILSHSVSFTYKCAPQFFTRRFFVGFVLSAAFCLWLNNRFFGGKYVQLFLSSSFWEKKNYQSLHCNEIHLRVWCIKLLTSTDQSGFG